MADKKRTRQSAQAEGTKVLWVDNGDGTFSEKIVIAAPAGGMQVSGPAAEGAAASGNPVRVAGWDGANVRTIKTNTDGEILVNLETADIEIGAVEIKNALDDTRATVDANGLHVNVRAIRGTDADGAPPTVAPLLIAGQDGVNVQSLKTNATGQAEVVEASGAAIAASASVLDDWDEADRAKVNPIAGQAGVAAGAGAVDALTQRVTHASDDPAVASLSVLDDWDEADRAKVNLIAGQAGVQGGSGVTNALTQRVVLATDVALPAGTNAIGKLAANSGVDIGDVDVTSVVPGTGATALGKAEDVAHASGDTGVFVLAVRNDDDTVFASADGDYAPVSVDRYGRVRVNHAAITGYLIDHSADGDDALIPVKSANGIATASGDNVVLAAVSGKSIRVLSYALQVQEAGTVVQARFQDTATATNRTMPWWLFASADGTSQQGVVRNPGGDSHKYFETGSGVGLDLNLSGAIDVGWEITYVEVE